MWDCIIPVYYKVDGRRDEYLNVDKLAYLMRMINIYAQS
jgi:hypothetical protein